MSSMKRGLAWAAAAVLAGCSGSSGMEGLSATKPSGWEFPSHLTGGRYFIPADRRLCVCGSFWTPPDAWRASWSGFVPYQ